MHSMNGKRGAAYMSISRACSLCKRDHKACNGARPCARCVSSGFSDKCEDVVLKTRGRPRKRRAKSANAPAGPRRGLAAASPAGKHDEDLFGDGDTEDTDLRCHNISFFISSFPSPSTETLASGKWVLHPLVSVADTVILFFFIFSFFSVFYLFYFPIFLVLYIRPLCLCGKGARYHEGTKCDLTSKARVTGRQSFSFALAA